MKRILSFALSFPRRELQQIISMCHQINKFQNENFPQSPEGNRSIHLSFRQADLHLQTCIGTKTNLNNTYIFCMTPNQPKPPFPQGEGTANFGPFKLPASGFYHLSSYSLDANWKWLTCIAGLAYGAFDSQPRKRGCVPGEMPQTEMTPTRGCWLSSQAEHPGGTAHFSWVQQDTRGAQLKLCICSREAELTSVGANYILDVRLSALCAFKCCHNPLWLELSLFSIKEMKA